MASILDKYGIKEVADVTFYELGDDGKPTNPALYLDTLKVSTIEQTAEQVDARGGKGNAILLSWDYNKEITVTLEDALFSAKSMAIMFGNGAVATYSGNVMRTEEFVAGANSAVSTSTSSLAGWNSSYVGPDGKSYTKLNPKFYDATGATVSTVSSGVKYFCTYDLAAQAQIIEISNSTFPGIYYVTGDTYARNQESGKDEFFQFIIPKAKVQSENTITLEADGDPSTFNMNLTVLRPSDGVMMKLVKYGLDNGTDAAATTASLIHNHSLNPVNA